MEHKTFSDSVSVFLPTRGRYVSFEDSLYSISKTKEADSLLDLIILADQDTKSFQIAQDFSEKHKFHSYKVIYSAKRLYPVKAFVSLYEICSSMFFFWTTNRVKYKEDWLVDALSFFKEHFPDKVGVLAMGGKRNKANIGMSSQEFVRYNEGSWFSSFYRMNYCDDELACRAILLGRYFFMKNSLVSFEDTEDLLYPSEDKKVAFKKVDRSLFYERTSFNFNLPVEKMHSWKGFRNINLPLKGDLG